MNKMRWMFLVIIAFIFIGLWFTMIFIASNYDLLFSIIATLGACFTGVIIVVASALVVWLLE